MKSPFLPFLVLGAAALPVAAVDVRVTIENLAPANGTFLTPVWVGFHDGGFDLYDRGAPASPALERLAEDGTIAPLSAAFLASGAGVVDGAVFGPTIPPIAPGETASADFSLDALAATSRWFSYASMIIPSNDAFIANGNPTAFRIFADDGTFLGAEFTVLGTMVLDAGTEVNDELPASTAFFGQAVPDTGTVEGGVVELHPGFNPPGSGGILDDPRFSAADFLAPGYQVARIRVQPVPEPGTVAGGAVLAGLAAWAGWRRRRA
jgi:hypothetical protein